MRRSLFMRLAATHLVIAAVSMLSLGILLSGLLQSFIFHEKEQSLIRFGRSVSRLVGEMSESPWEARRTMMRLQTLAELADARIWIAAPDGRIVADSEFPHARPGLQLAPEEMQKILTGETVVYRGLFRGRFRAPVISVGLPLSNGGRPVGAVFLHSPVRGVREALVQIYRLVGLAVLAAAGVALVLSLWLSRRLAQPLREMSEAAQELARGRFDRRVKIPTADDEIRRLALSFNYMASQLGDLERLRREFIANVSHELRSPLTSMRGFLQGVLDGTIPPAEQHRYLSLAFDETRRLSRLVNDLLDLAALESGDVQFHLTRVGVADLLTRAAAKMEPQAGEKGVRLQVEPDAAGAVRGDPDRLEQVLINLLDNAIRFTPQGGTVTLSAAPRGDVVEICVRDTGPGIPPEDLDRIWERFYKGDRARTRSKGGTGLGLAIARELVERQGGTIRAESRPGAGTAFFVTLPAAG